MYQLCNLRIFVGRLFTSSGLTRGLPYWYLYATSLTGKYSNWDKYWTILIPWEAAASPYSATTSRSYCSSSPYLLDPTLVWEITLRGAQDCFACSPSWATYFSLASVLLFEACCAACDLRTERS